MKAKVKKKSKPKIGLKDLRDEKVLESGKNLWAKCEAPYETPNKTFIIEIGHKNRDPWPTEVAGMLLTIAEDLIKVHMTHMSDEAIKEMLIEHIQEQKPADIEKYTDAELAKLKQ